MRTASLFGGAVDAVLQGPGWRVWRPGAPPVPAVHPLDETERCFNATAMGTHLATTMCLPAKDVVGDEIRKREFWHDCGAHVRLWQRLDGKDFSSLRHGRRLPPTPDDPDGVLLEVGANIGACTIELLLRTRAKVIAFEPSPTNLFYLTRSLQFLCARYPEMASRVVVFPVAAGEQPGVARVLGQRGNLGNTVLGSVAAIAPKPKHETWLAEQSAHVVPLDDLFPNGFGRVRHLKVDVQGFECKVVRGMWRAISRSPALQTVVVEVAALWLKAQCCHSVWLLHMLRHLGGPPQLVGLSRGTTNKELYGALPPGRVYGSWNVSCISGLSERGKNLETTCITRPYKFTRAGAVTLDRESLAGAKWLTMNEGHKIRERPSLPSKKHIIGSNYKKGRSCELAEARRGSST